MAKKIFIKTKYDELPLIEKRQEKCKHIFETIDESIGKGNFDDRSSLFVTRVCTVCRYVQVDEY